MLDRSIVRNIGLVSVGTLPSRSPWLRPGEMLDAARRQIDHLRIKVGDPTDQAGSLSGGNQQKVVIGKWLEVAPRVMLLDDPTRGVDVGAKREIYLLIRALADEGRIVLFRSTELPELVGLADRILVFYRGRLCLELPGADDVRSRGATRHQYRTAARAIDGRCLGIPGGGPMIRTAFTMRLQAGRARPSTGTGTTTSGRSWSRSSRLPASAT